MFGVFSLFIIFLFWQKTRTVAEITLLIHARGEIVLSIYEY